MTTPSLVPATPWGERIELLPKHMRYAASLEFRATTGGLFLDVEPSAGKTSAIRHLFDEAIITVPEGIRCSVPRRCDIRSGYGQIGTASAPRSSNLLVGISAKLDDDTFMNLTCTGVASFRGGSDVLRRSTKTVSGSAFITTNAETVSATYRWLTRRQLFGVGRIEGERSPRRSSKEWTLAFSFDLYAAF
ncbi:MAG TPA: hypothetical protein VKZ18_21700 [Polyangia bacterium]|nr:hypothetical protein [Polyangia bacterium]